MYNNITMSTLKIELDKLAEKVKKYGATPENISAYHTLNSRYNLSNYIRKSNIKIIK